MVSEASRKSLRPCASGWAMVSNTEAGASALVRMFGNPQKVVPAGGGNLERAFGAFLALDVAQVELCRLLRVHL
jgi:hypothetical protein